MSEMIELIAIHRVHHAVDAVALPGQTFAADPQDAAFLLAAKAARRAPAAPQAEPPSTPKSGVTKRRTTPTKPKDEAPAEVVADSEETLD